MALNIYLTCPVKQATDKEKAFLSEYVNNLEANGHKVHYPARDTTQTGDSKVFETNLNAIKTADEVHI